MWFDTIVRTETGCEEITDRIDGLGFARDDPIAVVCEGGVCSSTACSLLEMRGYRNLANVAGGMTAWTAAGLPTIPSGGDADDR